MKQEINYSRYVDRYLDDVMSVSEKNWFEKELEDNAELQAEIDLQKKINKVLSDQDTFKLQAQLDKVYLKTYRPWGKTVNISKKKMAYLLSGIAATLILAFVLIHGRMQQSSSVSIYAQYYQPADINMSFRTAEDIVDSDLRLAMIYYENKDFPKAIEHFENILKTDDSRIGLNLYSGISRMEIEQYAEANKNFKRIIDHRANAFIESAEWYLGLCYIMTDETEKAREVFTKIASEDGYYKKDARKILKKLD